jgi:cysteine desulfurase
MLLHVDAAQSTGKLPIDLVNTQVDLMSFSAHKTYGPKGIGALFVRRKPRVRLEAQIHGGGHERGFRSGTLATHQIVGMGEAFRIAREEGAAEQRVCWCCVIACGPVWPGWSRCSSTAPRSTASPAT